MFNDKEYLKIKRLIKLEKEYEKLYQEVGTILEKKYKDFECGDRIGNIVNKSEIPLTAQKNEDGTYTTYHQIGEDYGNGIVYLPLSNDGYEEFLEIYYST